MNSYIDIRFYYNGNLGVLQQKTIDNKVFCNRLLQMQVITYEEHKKMMIAICDYFKEEIEKVANHPEYYTNW